MVLASLEARFHGSTPKPPPPNYLQRLGTIPLIRFSSQENPEILNALYQIADIEGRKFHAVLDEAFRNFLNKKALSMSNCLVMASFTQSPNEFEDLFKELVK